MKVLPLRTDEALAQLSPSINFPYTNQNIINIFKQLNQITLLLSKLWKLKVVINYLCKTLTVISQQKFSAINHDKPRRTFHNEEKKRNSQSARVVIPRGFCIPKCFQYIIFRKGFRVYPTTATTKSSQVLHCNFSHLNFPNSAFPTLRNTIKRLFCMLTTKWNIWNEIKTNIDEHDI